MIFYMAGLDFDTGMETKQIFSIPSDPKPRKKRVDYEINNYCATCRIKYPKDILTCSDCKHRIRTTGWRSRKEADKKRI
jgi:hypothetical protein